MAVDVPVDGRNDAIRQRIVGLPIAVPLGAGGRWQPHCGRGRWLLVPGPIVPTPVGYACGMVQSMTETPESRDDPNTVTGQPRYDDSAPSRLGQVAAWVLIIAGTVFVAAVIFFSGLILGWSSGSPYAWHHGYYGGHTGSCPMMGPDGMMAPDGMMGPGAMMGPMGPGGPMGPRQTAPTTAPPTPRP